jgi:hypothetical protein
MPQVTPTRLDKKSINLNISTTGPHTRIQGRNGLSAGNGAVNVTLKHAFGLQKAVKMLPNMLSIPHVFPNVKEDSEILLVANGMTIVADFTLPSGWYTTQQFIDALEVNGFLNIDTSSIISIDPLSGKFVFSPDGNTYVLTMPSRLFYMIGYQENALLDPSGNTILGTAPWMWDVIATTSDLPNFAGVTSINVLANNIGNFNSVTNIAQLETDHPPVVCTISLTDTPYGGTALYRAAAIHLDDIDFKSEYDISSFDFFVTDQNYEQLYIPTNHHINMIFKVFHEDGFESIA